MFQYANIAHAMNIRTSYVLICQSGAFQKYKNQSYSSMQMKHDINIRTNHVPVRKCHQELVSLVDGVGAFDLHVTKILISR